MNREGWFHPWLPNCIALISTTLNRNFIQINWFTIKTVIQTDSDRTQWYQLMRPMLLKVIRKHSNSNRKKVQHLHNNSHDEGCFTPVHAKTKTQDYKAIIPLKTGVAAVIHWAIRSAGVVSCIVLGFPSIFRSQKVRLLKCTFPVCSESRKGALYK